MIAWKKTIFGQRGMRPKTRRKSRVTTDTDNCLSTCCCAKLADMTVPKPPRNLRRWTAK
nr:MAG TPA: hypothetical protein [Caudoviricetes sp.]